MKNNNILNAELISQIAAIGHTQQLVICDAGLPIPQGVPCIDLALIRGVPSFLELLKAVSAELIIESYIYADEMQDKNPDLLATMDRQLVEIPHCSLPHTEFKKLTEKAKVIVRTGECSPYANVILVAGVNF